ncbi:MAG: hypothetical protein HY744_12450 [Deltaproteobacteria bacterium]|nr:hypothetical protein [Deltaproteobacteria bacterium]
MTAYRLARFLLLAPVACGPATGVTSSLARPARPQPGAARPARWLANDRIPDFSFAGYHMGERPVPRVPAVTDATRFGVRADGVTDDTPALRAALDATRDGALVLPAGRIVLRDAARIPLREPLHRPRRRRARAPVEERRRRRARPARRRA